MTKSTMPQARPQSRSMPMDLQDMMPKFNTTRRSTRWVALPLLTMLALPAFAQTWKINLMNADINAFVSEVADITGKNFAVDPRVKGNVTVISNKALNRDQVYDLFQGVLNVNGVVAIPSGNTIKLVPDVNAKQSGVPFDFRNKARGDGVVTRVIWLDNTNPNDLVPAIRPLMSQFAHLAAVPGTNALIVSDRAGSIDQLAGLVRSLDGGADDKLEVISLKETNVDDLITQIDALTATSVTKDVRGSRLRIIADSRNNRLLVKGDDRARQRIKALVNQLDVPPRDILGGMHVFHLKNASAKSMATMLQGLISGSGSGSSKSNGYSASSTPSASMPSDSASNNASSSSSSSNSTNSTSMPTVFSANGVSIIANEELNAVVVKADPTMMREIGSTIEQLDVRRAQVLIQAAIVEVSGSNVEQLGVQWALGNASSGVGLINFSNAGASIATIAGAVAAKSYTSIKAPDGALLGLGKSTTNSAGQTSFYGAVINALNTTSGANLISVPSVMALDNVKAEMIVGQNVPFITGTTATTAAVGGTTTPFTTVERKDVGVTLKVTPHIGEGGTLRLEIEQEVSAIVPTSSLTASTSDVVTSKRAVKTTVLADNGQTIVLGGMMQDDNTQSVNAIPGLGSIPWLGGLFRSKANAYNKDNLLIFLQPTILRDGANADSLSQDRYDQIRVLQLELDPKGGFSRLPLDVNQIYTQAAVGVNPELTAAMKSNLNKHKVAAQKPATDETPVARSSSGNN
ncbi:MAG: type II secretion system secretin GspD [Gammaproteobacteria bacterium]|nr:type II secretion system secretin GspD [Gammaproteobacteria bacterium]